MFCLQRVSYGGNNNGHAKQVCKLNEKIYAGRLLEIREFLNSHDVDCEV